MDKKYIGIVIKAEAYRENDKLIRLFTSDNGIITAVMRGVKKKDAKLRYFAQIFAFGEFEIMETKGSNVVKTCSYIEDLTLICTSPEAYSSACVCIEAAALAETSVNANELFIMILKTLKTFLESDYLPELTAAKFMQKLLSLSGFVVRPERGNTKISKLLYDISRVPLSGLVDIPAEKIDARAAMLAVCRQFENSYETQLKSLKGLVSTLANL